MMMMMFYVYLVCPKMMIMRFDTMTKLVMVVRTDDGGGSLWRFLWCVLIYDDGLNQNDVRTNRIMDQRDPFGARSREEQKL